MRRRRDPPRFLEYERRAGGAPSELDLVAHHGKRKSLLHLLHPLGLEVVVPQHFLCTEQVLYLQSPDLREPRMVAPVRERHVEEKKVRLFVDEGAEMVEDDFLARERCRHIDGALEIPPSPPPPARSRSCSPTTLPLHRAGSLPAEPRPPRTANGCAGT